MSQSSPGSLKDRFNRAAGRLTSAAGSPFALLAAVLVIVVWALSGPIFAFSETWQLVINTGTTIITFLMVFVIQAAQNRDSKAIHLKLDEIIRSQEGARNEFISTEQSSEEQIQAREAELLRIAEEGGQSTADPEVRAAVRDHAELDARGEHPHHRLGR